MSKENPALSIVIPAKNEEANILPLVTEIHQALEDKIDFEIIYVNDGSTDKTRDKLIEAREKFPRLRFVSHKKSCGQSRAIVTGVSIAAAPFVATLDGDGQNDPADLFVLFQTLQEQADKEKVLMAGWRTKRQDVLSKRLTSKFGNAIRKSLLQDDTPDTGCGTKIFPKAAFMEMPHFDHMHRYLPALMKRQGGRTISVPVNHRPRERGVSNYGFWDRLWVGLSDIFGVMWLMHRCNKSEIISE
ncbi:MAG: glycosyltransferase family 2 protein [Alphaproteobacteria bacterium]|nr:glycosyltransferase family 2 protein [Alphaproteobacteria bacterium]